MEKEHRTTRRWWTEAVRAAYQGTDEKKQNNKGMEKLLGLTVQRMRLTHEALIELNNNYCLKCLACNIGIDILKPNNK